jgi:hypothetical protein
MCGPPFLSSAIIAYQGPFVPGVGHATELVLDECICNLVKSENR